MPPPDRAPCCRSEHWVGSCRRGSPTAARDETAGPGTGVLSSLRAPARPGSCPEHSRVLSSGLGQGEGGMKASRAERPTHGPGHCLRGQGSGRVLGGVFSWSGTNSALSLTGLETERGVQTPGPGRRCCSAGPRRGEGGPSASRRRAARTPPWAEPRTKTGSGGQRKEVGSGGRSVTLALLHAKKNLAPWSVPPQ